MFRRSDRSVFRRPCVACLRRSVIDHRCFTSVYIVSLTVNRSHVCVWSSCTFTATNFAARNGCVIGLSASISTTYGLVVNRDRKQNAGFAIHCTLSHFTFWISLSLSEIAKHTHRPQGVNYHGYLHVLKYLLLLYLNRKA